MAARDHGGKQLRRLRVYVDTSVFGGVCDDEFRDASKRFFAKVHAGSFVVVASDALVIEISRAPLPVQEVFSRHRTHMEAIETTTDVTDLAQAYLAARVLPMGSRMDAIHVALASIARVDVLVSWNFKHLVQLRRIRGFHAVNLMRGYPPVEIRSPREIVDDEES